MIQYINISYLVYIDDSRQERVCSEVFAEAKQKNATGDDISRASFAPVTAARSCRRSAHKLNERGNGDSRK